MGVAQALQSGTPVDVLVVLKDMAFENWLIADIDAISTMSARYSLSKAAIDAVAPDKADRVNGYRWLMKATDGTYDKKRDAKRILAAAQPSRIAANSRSFRRFLRVLGHPAYKAQSKAPANS
jgi:Domain of unknown function (DUF4276)